MRPAIGTVIPGNDEAQAGATALGSKRNTSDAPNSADGREALQPQPVATNKRISTLLAAFALRGHVLQVQVREGRLLYVVSRWGQARVFSHVNDLDAFLAQLGSFAAVQQPDAAVYDGTR